MTVSDNSIRDKTFNITKNKKYDGCQCGYAFLV